MLAAAYCLAISVLYVSSLYVWRGMPASRQHPQTVKARMVSVLLTCCLAWVPAWRMRSAQSPPLTTLPEDGSLVDAAVGPSSVLWSPHEHQQQQQQQQQQLPSMLQLLGVHIHGQQLAKALLAAVSLTLLLFLGPLYHRLLQTLRRRGKGEPSGAWQAAVQGTSSSYSSSTIRLHQARDYVVSPLAEEWCFRACMVPLLWMQGYNWRVLILVTPLFFGVCHLHHGWHLAQAYGLSRQVVAMLLLQLLYTTVFGWYATWIFLSTGSILAAVAVHSICNMFGLPPINQMDRGSLLLCAVGVVLFAGAAPRVLVQPDQDSAFWWGRRHS